MKLKIIFLRIGYWVPAIADFVIAISVLSPERMGLTAFVYPMGLVSAIAFSWGILLIIADRKPVERRWALIPTMVVIALLIGVRIYAGLNGLIELSIPFILLGMVILFIVMFGYFISKDLGTAHK
jgi:hypothetical protein